MIAKWINVDSIEYTIACNYADGKGCIFEMFFGWRGIKGDKAKMVFSRKDWKKINTMVEYSKKYLTNI